MDFRGDRAYWGKHGLVEKNWHGIALLVIPELVDGCTAVDER